MAALPSGDATASAAAGQRDYRACTTSSSCWAVGGILQDKAVGEVIGLA